MEIQQMLLGRVEDPRPRIQRVLIPKEMVIFVMYNMYHLG